MSLAGPNRKPALTAAASKIAFSRVTADKLKEEDWQVRAWGVYDKLPSVFYMTRYRSDIASKIEYFVGTIQDPSQDPEADDGAGAKVLEAEGGPELLRRIVSEFVVHWDVPGEGYLTRFEEPPFWRVLSTQELKKQGQGQFLWGDESTNLGTIDSDNVYRVWDSHPRFHWQADSPVRHILEEAEELILLSRAAKVQSMSQVSAGILILPDSIDLSPFAEDTEGTEDDVARWLIQVLAKPVSDSGSSASVVPAVMTMHGDDIEKVRHLTFDRDWQVNLELRRELLAAVATGLDLPPEILNGMADLNHWSAWLVSEQAVNQHVLPSVDAILDSLTQNWFRPLLEASGVDPDLYVLWRDPSPATVPPDQSDVAIRLNELGVISDEATRRVTNFDEEDKPSPEELERKAAMKPAPSEESPRNQDSPPVRASMEDDPPLPGAAVTAAVRRRIVATELADLDAELLAWVVEESDKEIERLLNLALTAADDPIDESLLVPLGQRLERRIAEAQAAARGWLARTLGRTPSDEGESLARSQGVQVILAGIVEAVRRKLFTPDARPDPIDLGRMPDITTPTEAIRNGLSLAGGGPAIYEDGNTSELIGNGQKVKEELAGDGFFVDGYEWKYGNPANTFEPHLRLDGVQFASWDDPRLAVGLNDSWLRRSHYRPGDHKGCQCAFVQVIIEPLAMVGPEGTDLGVDPSGRVVTGRHYEGFSADQRRVFNDRLDQLERKYGVKPTYAGTGNDATGRRLAVESLEQRLDRPNTPFNRHAVIQKDIDFINEGGNPLQRPSYAEDVRLEGGATPNGEVLSLGNGRYALYVDDRLEAIGSRPDAIPELQATVTHEYGHVWHSDITDLANRSPVPYISADVLEPQTFAGVLQAAERAMPSTTPYSEFNRMERIAEAFRLNEQGTTIDAVDILSRQANQARSWQVPTELSGNSIAHANAMQVLREMMGSY